MMSDQLIFVTTSLLAKFAKINYTQRCVEIRHCGYYGIAMCSALYALQKAIKSGATRNPVVMCHQRFFFVIIVYPCSVLVLMSHSKSAIYILYMYRLLPHSHCFLFTCLSDKLPSIIIHDCIYHTVDSSFLNVHR